MLLQLCLLEVVEILEVVVEQVVPPGYHVVEIPGLDSRILVQRKPTHVLLELIFMLLQLPLPTEMSRHPGHSMQIADVPLHLLLVHHDHRNLTRVGLMLGQRHRPFIMDGGQLELGDHSTSAGLFALPSECG